MDGIVSSQYSWKAMGAFDMPPSGTPAADSSQYSDPMRVALPESRLVAVAVQVTPLEFFAV